MNAEEVISYLQELQSKIDSYAENSISEFKKHIYYSHIGDLNTAINVIKKYEQINEPCKQTNT